MRKKNQRILAWAMALKQYIRTATRAVRRNCWVGCTFALAGLGLSFAIFLASPPGASATAVIKLLFERPNSDLWTQEQYATNGFGWRVAKTEAAVLSSEFILRKALQRLGREESAVCTNNCVRAALVPDGIRIHASGRNMQEARALANAVAEAYQEDRNATTSVPPGCKALLVTISEGARPANISPSVRSIFRCAFGSLLLGFAAAVYSAGGGLSALRSVVFMVIFWLSSLSGLGLLIAPLTLAQAFTVAATMAILLTSVGASIDLVKSANAPVVPGLFKFAALIAFAVVIGTGVLSILAPSETWDSIQIRLRILAPRPDVGNVVPAPGGEEFPMNYDSQTIATECDLIRSAAILNQTVDSEMMKVLNKHFRVSLTPKEVEAWMIRSTEVNPVPNTSLIEIRCRVSPPWPVSLSPTRIAETYRNYYNLRSKTNLTSRVVVNLLGSALGSHPSAQRRVAQAFMAALAATIYALFLLGGILAAALLARNPARLSVFPAAGLIYLFASGAASLLSFGGSGNQSATCVVRVWPPTENPASPGWKQRSSMIAELVRKECEFAGSKAVVSDAVPAINEADGSGAKTSRKGGLKVYLIEGTFLIAFKAESERAHEAAAAANVAAASYLRLRGAGLGPSAPAWWKPNMEVLGNAVAGRPSVRLANALSKGLGDGFWYFILFLVGAGIGYLGFIAEEVRRAKLNAS